MDPSKVRNKMISSERRRLQTVDNMKSNIKHAKVISNERSRDRSILNKWKQCAENTLFINEIPFYNICPLHRIF